jgi:hypothetical protein
VTIYSTRPPATARAARRAWDYFRAKHPKKTIGKLYYTPNFEGDFKGWIAEWQFTNEEMDRIMGCWGVGYWDDWKYKAASSYDIQRWAQCDCQCPEPESGVAGVSEGCPVHAGKFHVITTVM